MFTQLFDAAEKVKPNARFFRLLVLMILVTVIISRFPWTNGLLARIITVPELRHSFNYQPTDNNATLMKANVANFGQVKADNVLLHFQSRDGAIQSYFIESQDNYVIQKEDLQNGLLDIHLDRLAPGASIKIEIMGQIDQSQSEFSATSDQGASIDTEIQSFNQQLEEYAERVTTLYEKTLKLIKKNSPIDTTMLIQSGEGGIEGFSDLILMLESEEFKTVFFATVAISLLIGLFLPHLAVLIPFIAAIGVALLADFQISLGFVIALTAVGFLPAVPSILRIIYETAKEEPGKAFRFGIFWLAIFMSWIPVWDDVTSARWLFFPTIVLVFDVLLIISIVIPTESVERVVENNEHRLVIQTEQLSSDGYSIETLQTTIQQLNDRLTDVEQQLKQRENSTSMRLDTSDEIIKRIRQNYSNTIHEQHKDGNSGVGQQS